jgi:hypothetical protein
MDLGNMGVVERSEDLCFPLKAREALAVGGEERREYLIATSR